MKIQSVLLSIVFVGISNSNFAQTMEEFATALLDPANQRVMSEVAIASQMGEALKMFAEKDGARFRNLLDQLEKNIGLHSEASKSTKAFLESIKDADNRKYMADYIAEKIIL